MPRNLQIAVRPELHLEIKKRAVEAKKTMCSYLEQVLTEYWLNERVRREIAEREFNGSHK